MRPPSWWPARGPWRHPAFVRLWAAQVVSAFGSRLTRTALPILALVALDADDGALGVLAALQLGPAVAVALVAGGAIDRGRKRRVLVACDLVRALLVASLPVAAWLGALTMAHVCVAAGGVGAATALFRIADGALLPRLIDPARLAETNAIVEGTEAAAEIAGPAAAGVLIRLAGAPLAILIDAATYVWSAAFLARVPEPAPAATADDTAAGEAPSVARDLAIGVRAIAAQPIVRRLVAADLAIAAAGGFFASMYAPLCLRELGLSTAAFGAIVGCGGIGAIAGAAVAARLGRRRGATLVTCAALVAGAMLLVPLAARVGGPGAIALLVGQQLVGDAALMVLAIHATTLRQTLVPVDQLGRAGAAHTAATTAVLLLASLGSGALGAAIGTRAAFAIGPWLAVLAPLALAPLARTPLAQAPEPDAAPRA